MDLGDVNELDSWIALYAHQMAEAEAEQLRMDQLDSVGLATDDIEQWTDETIIAASDEGADPVMDGRKWSSVW
jgi:hypothetical protein